MKDDKHRERKRSIGELINEKTYSFIKSYATYLSHHPYTVLFLFLLITGIGAYYAQFVHTQNIDYKTLLPQSLEVVKGINIIDDKFGGSDTILVVVQLSPQNISDPQDILDPKVIKYIYLLSDMLKNVDYVSKVSSGALLLKQLNNNTLPQSKNKILSLVSKYDMFSSYFDKKRDMAIIRVNLLAGYKDEDVVKEIESAINSVPKVPGVKVGITGEPAIDPAVREALKPDMAKTSRISMLGILIILFLLFRSIPYTLIPLSTILFGTILAFGYVGFIGMGISSATSGVMSMIMGIGIDFGIQTSNRFKQELEEMNKNKVKNKVEQAMINTLYHVTIPMATTTLSALIGFKAMSMGQISIMKQLGEMMSYGITACFFTAITLIPAIIIIYERFKQKKR